MENCTLNGLQYQLKLSLIMFIINNSILVFEDADIIKSSVKDGVDSQSSQI